jgi:protein DEK
LWLPRRRRRRRRRAITTIREERIMADEQELTAVEEVVNAERKVEKAVENHQPEEDKGKEIAHVSKDDVKGSEMDIDNDEEKLEVAKEEQKQQENDKAQKEEEKMEEDVVEEEKEKEEEVEQGEAEQEDVEQVEEEEEEMVAEEGKKEKETKATTKKTAGRPKKGRAKSEELSTPRGRGEKRQRQKKEIFPFFTDRPTRERKSIERFIASVEKETNKDIEIKQVLQPAGFSFLFFSQRVFFFPAAAEHISSTLSFPSFFLSSPSLSFLPARDRQTDNRTRFPKSS